MRRAAAVLAVVTAAVGGAFAVGASGEGGPGTRYRILLDNAFGLVEGGDFKVAGIRAGAIESFELTEEHPAKAIVEVAVEEEGLRAFRADARCEVRLQSLIGEYFVDCQPGQSGEPLPNNTVPVEQTASTVPLDVINNILRRPFKERLRIIILTLGTGLAGRPEDLSEVVRRAHPGLRETNETLAILAEQEQIIERFVADSDTVIEALEERKQDVVRFVREAGETAEVSASRRAALAETFDRLPTFLAELEPTMEELGELADAQIPVLRNLRRGADDLEETFRRLEPFSEASEPALVSLGELADAGLEAIRSSDEEIRELRELAKDAPGLAKRLSQYLRTIDDRERAIEVDPRAKETDPPAPDKTHIPDGEEGGFTGMEALLNYFYWQTLAINGFDQVSHVLRFTGFLNSCSGYFADPTPEEIERCNSWLGPHQPGINAPDPTEGGRAAGSAGGGGRSERGSRSRAGERGAGEGFLPEAEEPRPGERDPSKPRVVLPELVEKLLGDVTRPRRRIPAAPAPGGTGSERVLDFLLAP